MDESSFIVQSISEQVDIVEIAKKLQDLPSIEIAEPDFHQSFVACEFTLPSDDLLHKQWCLDNNGKDPLGNND